MIKNQTTIIIGFEFFLLIFTLALLSGCKTSNSNKDNKTANYPKKTESITTEKGIAVYNLEKENIYTHRLEKGDKNIFVYERTGTTILDGEDWDVKYKETLIFQIDSILSDFKFCNEDLKEIECKYFWICYSKNIKKEIRDVSKGCINGTISTDSIHVDININTDFGFGSFMEKNDKRKVKFNIKSNIPN